MVRDTRFGVAGGTATALLLTLAAACGGSSDASYSDGAGSGSSGGSGSGGTGSASDDGSSSTDGASSSGTTDASSSSSSTTSSTSSTTSGSGSGTTGGSALTVTPIPGGGANSAPLGVGCGPDTASDCHPQGGSCAGAGFDDHEIKSAGTVCFYGEGYEEPSATVEHITEVVDGQEYVHLRVTFDPDFVDTAYGECSPETGWSQVRGHTFRDLLGSDHVELLLYDCGGGLAMHFLLDFIETDAASPCGYSSAGVSGGDGEMVVGDPNHILEATSSLDRNMNGCGYCDDQNSPCTDTTYAADPDAPEWDFRMVYEVWIDPAAFGSAGFCTSEIEYVHASPAKTEDETIIVEPKDCPGGNECPPDYELFLTSEGEYVCGGPPGDGICPDGYTVDLTSEGELCIEEGGAG